MILCPLSRNASLYSRQDALISGQRVFSWDLLNAYVISTSRHLKEINILKGSRVMIISENSLPLVILLLSLWRGGVTAVLLDPSSPEDFVVQSLETSGLKFVFIPASGSKKASFLPKSPKKGFKILLIDDMINYQFSTGFFGNEMEEITMDPDFEAAVIMSQDPSGRPSRTSLSYHNLYSQAEDSQVVASCHSSVQSALSAPLYHVSGVSIFFRALVGAGAMVIPEGRGLLFKDDAGKEN
ncbi:MAG: AMP-binding protein [Candidatus Omnitrophica bacterium]|nr:AMP-binding protein [Candidatus Omnitrophota bacterium]